jgi:diaminopropionate ammonia-lyase
VEALNAGKISSIAWPAIRDEVDAAVMVSDGMAARARGRMSDLGVPAGMCGGASLAGVAHLLNGRDPAASWSIDANSTVVVVSTDGA